MCFDLMVEGLRVCPLSRSLKVVLAEREILSFVPGREPTEVCVLEGEVWATQPGNGGDFVLRAGDLFVSRGRGKVVVQALGGGLAVIRVQRERASGAFG